MCKNRVVDVEMAHGLNSVLNKRSANASTITSKSETKSTIGSRRIFAPHFKLQVLDSYRNDADCKGNQRATARKYGIHRRQIQKWLQVESNLRSSVTSTPTSQAPPIVAVVAKRDEATAVATPAVHDFGAPIDLSLKRSAPASAPPLPLRVSSPLTLHYEPHPDVWDLSTTKRKKYDSSEEKSPSSNHAESKPPVKLFKPYLDDCYPTERKSDQISPCCSYYSNNNNNNNNLTVNNNNLITDIKSEYSSYTLHELQTPKTSPIPVGSFYLPPYNSGYHASEYELSSGYCMNYDDPNYLPNCVPLKQRHSYSLDFKLSAIDCYYQDSVCKGNQRAVATKYNIHRRQVQKWLKQADELRERNETVKHTQTVR